MRVSRHFSLQWGSKATCQTHTESQSVSCALKKQLTLVTKLHFVTNEEEYLSMSTNDSLAKAIVEEVRLEPYDSRWTGTIVLPAWPDDLRANRWFGFRAAELAKFKRLGIPYVQV